MVPEKIYIPTAGNELHYHMTCPRNEFQESVEYTSTDAFIEKACKWLYGAIYDYLDTGSIGDFETLRGVKNEQFLEDFKKYMKRE